MSNLESLLNGFASALTLTNLGFGLLGTFLGTLVGVLPGIGPALAIALLLPITYTVSPASALIMFASIYYGAMYGGSTTSILLNTPGESGSVITALEGNKMARRGRAGAALATAAIGSFVAGTIATFVLAFTAPTIADLAIQVGSADYVGAGRRPH
jgi:putative tricarboxylic transport membrane protein